MRVRPVHISFLKEARNALSYRHCSFHIINRPQKGRPLKYFMRLVAIGSAYRKAEVRSRRLEREKPDTGNWKAENNFRGLHNFKADHGDQFCAE